MGTLIENPSADTYLDGVSKTTIRGAANQMYLGAFVFAGTKAILGRPLLNFDLSAIPAGATIDTAKLTVEVYTAINTGPTGTVSRCTRPDTWVESEAQWNDFASGSAWTAGGGDFDDTGPPAGVDFTLPGSTGSFDITGLATMVQAAYDAGDEYSVIIRTDDENPADSEFIAFDSSEGTTQPVLEVVYTTPTSTGRPGARKMVQVI